MKRILFLFCFITSCASVKHQMADATKYEQSGMPDSALAIYQEVYNKKGKVEAHIAMNRLVNQQVNKLLSEIELSKMSGDFSLALSRCESLTEILDSAPWYSPSRDINVSEIKQTIVLEKRTVLMGRVRQLILDKQHLQADVQLSELKSMGERSEEYYHLVRLNSIIPLYYNAEKAFENGFYSEAYDHFKEVLDLDIGYKDAKEKLERCVEELKFSMAVISPDAKIHSEQKTIAKAIKARLDRIDSPFMQLIDPEHDELILAEQRRSMSGLTGGVIEAGNLLEANYILIGRIERLEHSATYPSRKKQEGFDGANPRCKKVEFFEVSRAVSFHMLYSYEIVNTQSGQLITSGEVTIDDDFVHSHIEYSGNRENLHPGNWSFAFITLKSDQIDFDGKPLLDEMLDNVPYLKIEKQLLTQYWAAISDQIAEEVSCLIDGGDFSSPSK